MDYPQSKKFLGWYLKEKKKRIKSPAFLVIQEKYNLHSLTEDRISRLQLTMMGALILKDERLYERTEECFRKVNEIYDAACKKKEPPATK